MQRAWSEIARLVRVDAQHRKGFRLSEITPAFILDQTQGELDELKAAPHDPEELADVLGCLFHYAFRMGWTPGQLEDLMLAKFAARFHEDSP